MPSYSSNWNKDEEDFGGNFDFLFGLVWFDFLFFYFFLINSNMNLRP